MEKDPGSGKFERGRGGFAVLHAAAYIAVGGVAVAEALNMPFGPRFWATAGGLVLFAAALFFAFRRERSLSRAGFVALAAVLTVLAAGISAAGAHPLYGTILMLVVCTLVGMSLPVAPSVAWAAVCVLCLAGTLLLRGEREWLTDTMTFSAGFFAFVAFAVSFRRSQQARAESQELLTELQGAQGRLREMAVMEERQRLAREMHDAVGHRLTAAAVLLEGAARLIPADPDRAARIVESSRVQVKEGLAELRAAVTALRGAETAGRGLEETLRALTDVFAQASRAEVSLEVQPGIPEPDPERATVIVRTVQEALTNVLKHAGAARVRLTLRRETGAYLLVCADDGRGPAARTGQGFGMPNLQSRAARFGGSVELRPGEGGGAVLSLTLPAGSMSDGG
jgi:signal transduction histidine kinase